MGSEGRARYRRELSLLDLTMASLGGIIGSGWLFASQAAANIAGPSALVSWLIGAVAVILIGLCYAELGGMLPEAGGIARYPQYTHTTMVSYLMAWAAYLAYVSVPPIEATAVIQYLAYQPGQGGWIPGIYANGSLTGWGFLLAAVLLLLFIVINNAGVRMFKYVNTPVTIWKFAIPALTIVMLLVSAHQGSVPKAAGGFAPFGLNGTFGAVASSGIIFSYLGFRQAVDLAGEARNPARDVPRAVIAAIVIGAVVYFFLQFAFLHAVPGSQLAHGWGKVSFSAPFANLATVLNLTWLAFLLHVDGVISPGGTGLVYTTTTARVAYAMSANQYFPRIFGRLSPRMGVPIPALVLGLILGFLFLLPFPSWSKLVGFVSSATVLTYIIGPVAVMVLRRDAPDLPRPTRVGGLGVIAPIAFIVASLIIYWSGWPTTGIVLGAALGGLMFYLVYFDLYVHQNVWTGREIAGGLWLVGFLVAIGIVSYIGSFGGTGLIPSPWDEILVAALGLGAFYVGVAQGKATAYLEAVKGNVQGLQAGTYTQGDVEAETVITVTAP
ncbi:MAG: amino acid permease [Firmicutes bacterium]|nr:amino acid permease [Bacillota bacterium]